MSDVLAKAEAAVATVYSDLAALRAIVAAIPILGASIDAFLGTRGQTITARRLRDAIKELERQASQLDQSKVDARYLESEDFFDLLWRAFERGMRTSQKEKVRLYVRVLLRSTEAPAHRENAQEYLELLADLTVTEVRVASALYKLQKDAKPTGVALESTGGAAKAGELQAELEDLTEDQVSTYLKRLERTGLVRELVGSYFGYAGDAFHITDYFREMMVYLALNDLTQVP